MVLALALLLGGRAEAQRVGPLPKYGKWALLAGALGMNLLAGRAHHDANVAFRELEASCLQTNSLCALAPDGTYATAATEALYQRTAHYDSRARTWLIGGETALLGAAALFIYELTQPRGLPGNKPFEPTVSRERNVTKVGLRLAF